VRRAREDGGQASVELALVLPLVMVLLLAVAQFGLLVRDQILVVHAAREAAREAAVDPAADAPRRAALASSTLAGDRLTVTSTGRGAPGSRVHVEVAYQASTSVPLVGAALRGVTVRASATMRVER
jgi:Flp pilus assembly protein TadG